MGHIDLATYLSDDTLVLDGVASAKYPDGKSYTIVSPSAEDGLRLQRVVQQSGPKLQDVSVDNAEILMALCRDAEGNEITLAEKLIGPKVHAEMVADGVSLTRISLIEEVLTLHYGIGPEVTTLVVAAAGEAVARANRASRRAAAKKAPSRKRTARKTAGSKSSPAAGGTPAQPRARTSTRLSKTTPAVPEAKAG